MKKTFSCSIALHFQASHRPCSRAVQVRAWPALCKYLRKAANRTESSAQAPTSPRPISSLKVPDLRRTCLASHELCKLQGWTTRRGLHEFGMRMQSYNPANTACGHALWQAAGFNWAGGSPRHLAQRQLQSHGLRVLLLIPNLQPVTSTPAHRGGSCRGMQTCLSPRSPAHLAVWAHWPLMLTHWSASPLSPAQPGKIGNNALVVIEHGVVPRNEVRLAANIQPMTSGSTSSGVPIKGMQFASRPLFLLIWCNTFESP